MGKECSQSPYNPKEQVKADSLPHEGTGLDAMFLINRQKLALLKKYIIDCKDEVVEDNPDLKIRWSRTNEECDCEKIGYKREAPVKVTHDKYKSVGGNLYVCREDKKCGGCWWWYAENSRIYADEGVYKVSGGNTKGINTDKNYKKLDSKNTKITKKEAGFNKSSIENKEEDTQLPKNCFVPNDSPILLCEGTFDSWCTEELYPDVEDDNCEKIFGDNAGKNVRLFKYPSLSKAGSYIGGHFYTSKDGVISKHTIHNDERRGAFVFMYGLKVRNIPIPDKLPKPLNENNPATITYVKRTESNKTVVASGLLLETFLGQTQTTDSGVDEFAVPCNGVNGPDFYDVNVSRVAGGANRFRGGKAMPEVDGKVSYVFHSPDTHFLRPNLDPFWCLFEAEVYGTGVRHGLYATEDEDKKDIGRTNQKGARSSVHLSRYSPIDPVVREVAAIGYVAGNEIGVGSDRFQFPLMNNFREATVYTELVTSRIPYSGYGSMFSGGGHETQKPVGPSDAGDLGYTDNSFIGDATQQERTLTARSWFVSFIRKIPRQYGNPLNQTYIPTGLEVIGKGDSGTLEVEGLCGDSYTNWHTFKRTSFVSDKVWKTISPINEGTPLGGLTNIPFIGPLVGFFFNSLGIRSCGYLPKAGENSGIVINMGLSKRGANDAVGVSTAEYEDTYYPSTQKTEIFGYYPSDVNIAHRITRDPELEQVHYKRRKGLNIDSSIPVNSDWRRGYLNRPLHMMWKEPSGRKMLVYYLADLLWVWGIGFWIMIQGIMLLSKATFGFSNAPMGAVFGAVLVLVAVAWIVVWINTDWENKFIANYLGIDLCYPDRRYTQADVPNGNGMSSPYSMNSGRVVNWVDNWFEIDGTHSRVQDAQISLGVSGREDTLCCEDEREKGFYVGRKQDMMSSIDSWRNFDPESYVGMPTDSGDITLIQPYRNEMLVFTTDHLVKYRLGDKEARPVFQGVVEGYAGLKDPNAAIPTIYGLIYPDREAKKWYSYEGGAPKPFSDRGMQFEFNNNMGLCLLDYFCDFKNVDLKSPNGIGYSVGVDHEHDKIFFTKRDYEPLKDKVDDIELTPEGMGFTHKGKPISLGDPEYFCNKSMTISYHAPTKTYSSFHYYMPVLYTWDRFNMFSFNEQGMWRHNVDGHYQTFYGKYYPFHIDVVVNDKQTRRTFTTNSIVVDMETYKWVECDYLFVKEFFSSGVFWNNHQNTGEITFLEDRELDLVESSKERTASSDVLFEDMEWKVNDFRNRLVDINRHHFKKDCEIGPAKVDETNIGECDGESTMNDKFLRIRLTYDKPDNTDVKILLKGVRSVIDNEN